MNLQDFSAIAQMIGSAAVIVTLIVLIGQIRANTRAVGRQMDEARLYKATGPFYQSPDLVRIAAKIGAAQGFGPATKELMETFALSPEEATLWFRHLMDNWISYEIEFRYGGTEVSPRAIKSNLRWPDGRIFWKHWKLGRSAEFVRYVDSLQIDSPNES